MDGLCFSLHPYLGTRFGNKSPAAYVLPLFISYLIDLSHTTAIKVPVTLIFFIFDEKFSHPWIQIQKRQLNFLRLSMGFDRKNKNLSFDRAYRGLVPMT